MTTKRRHKTPSIDDIKLLQGKLCIVGSLSRAIINMGTNYASVIVRERCWQERCDGHVACTTLKHLYEFGLITRSHTDPDVQPPGSRGSLTWPKKECTAGCDGSESAQIFDGHCPHAEKYSDPSDGFLHGTVVTAWHLDLDVQDKDRCRDRHEAQCRGYHAGELTWYRFEPQRGAKKCKAVAVANVRIAGITNASTAHDGPFSGGDGLPCWMPGNIEGRMQGSISREAPVPREFRGLLLVAQYRMYFDPHPGIQKPGIIQSPYFNTVGKVTTTPMGAIEGLLLRPCR
jgi:hypothetical protein